MLRYSFNFIYQNYVVNHNLENDELHISFTIYFIYQPLLVTSAIVFHYNSLNIERAYVRFTLFHLIDTGYDIHNPVRDYAEGQVWEFYARLYQEDEDRFQ